MQLKILSLVIILSACSSLPPFPEVVQYGVHADINPPGFYGVNNKTKAHVYKTLDDPSMKGAQCLNVDDYKASEEWISAVKQEAERRCQ